MKLETKFLVPLLILLVVLIIKNINTNKISNSQKVENFQNNVVPTTIDYRTINIKQGNTDGSYLLLGKFPSTKTNLSFYLDVLPNEHFNGRTQFGFSMSNDSKSCFHELVFGIPSFGNLMLILRNSDWHIVLKKVAPNDNDKYRIAMPCILTTSGDLNTSEFLNISNEGVSLLNKFSPTPKELEDAIISVQNTDRYKALVNQTLENNGLKLGEKTIEISKNLVVNADEIKLQNKNNNQWTISGKDNLYFKNTTSNSNNFTIGKNGSVYIKTYNGNGGVHLNNTLYWHR